METFVLEIQKVATAEVMASILANITTQDDLQLLLEKLDEFVKKMIEKYPND